MFSGTTILGVHKNGRVALAGDGQVTFGESNTIMKHKAEKIRTLYNRQVLAGFAGSVADAFTLFERFEGKLEEYNGSLHRASVELAKEWRMDKVLRRLEALLVVADVNDILVLSGNGEVIQPDMGIAAIGSGGPYAYAAASALYENTDLEPADVVLKSLEIASSICIYTNDNITLEEL